MPRHSSPPVQQSAPGSQWDLSSLAQLEEGQVENLDLPSTPEKVASDLIARTGLHCPDQRETALAPKPEAPQRPLVQSKGKPAMTRHHSPSPRHQSPAPSGMAPP